MAVDAHESEFVDVGLALGRCVPRNQMVCFTFRHVGPATNTAFISGDQPAYLCWCGVALLAALVENFAVCAEHGRRNSAVAGVTRQNRVGNDVSVGEFGGAFAGEEVVELDPHVNVPCTDPVPEAELIPPSFVLGRVRLLYAASNMR